MEADLQNNVTTSDRISYARKAMIQRIRENNDFQEFRGNLRPYYSRVDSSIFQRTWDADRASGLTDPLFVIGDKTVRQDDFTEPSWSLT